VRVAIVLAAGSSRRFGAANKLLAPLRGRPLLTHALDAAQAGPVAWTLVVTGADRARVATVARSRLPRARIVHARHHREGIAASLAAGLAALPQRVEEALVFLGDMPRIPPGLAGWLVRRRGGRGPSVRALLNGHPAHPVLLARADFAAAAALTGDRGPGAMLASRGARTLALPPRWRDAIADMDYRREFGR
jgi:molybdenum cofactor cytidylyltransferase